MVDSVGLLVTVYTDVSTVVCGRFSRSVDNMKTYSPPNPYALPSPSTSSLNTVIGLSSEQMITYNLHCCSCHVTRGME